MEFTTSNGQKPILINPASFREAANLKKAAMKCLQRVGILNDVNISNVQNIQLSNLLDKLFDLVLNLDTSDEFEDAVMNCLSACIYDYKNKNIKITQQLFDDIPEAREDYYEIVSKCCEVNLRPFLKSLISEFTTRLKQQGKSIPEQK